MFDISWTEFLLIGVVALVVIGPKELPGVMRSLGQWTRKLRSMAADFQNQFQEAMREAEMADLKKQVDDMAQDIKSYDPLKDVRADVESIGKDLEKPLDSTAEPKAVEPKPDASAAPALPDAGTVAPVAALPEPVAVAAEPDSTERSG
jgi:sec-independent protein translocase protein TatB